MELIGKLLNKTVITYSIRKKTDIKPKFKKAAKSSNMKKFFVNIKIVKKRPFVKILPPIKLHTTVCFSEKNQNPQFEEDVQRGVNYKDV